MKLSVSVHYLPKGIIMDMSKESAVQVRIWSWLNDFWQSNGPFTLKKKEIYNICSLSP
jgi:hypothetical protein